MDVLYSRLFAADQALSWAEKAVEDCFEIHLWECIGYKLASSAVTWINFPELKSVNRVSGWRKGMKTSAGWAAVKQVEVIVLS